MRLFELGNERPSLDKEFPRNIMPQIRIEHLKDSPFQTEHVKELTANLKPVQTQRVKGMVDKAKRGFADGTIRPIIVDRDNYIVNGHHRYDVARGTELDRVNVIRVDATIEELIKQFSRLPGLGPKSAKRIVLKLINNRDELFKSFLIDNDCINEYNNDNNNDYTKKDLIKKLLTRILYGGLYENWLKEFNTKGRLIYKLTLEDKLQKAKDYLDEIYRDYFVLGKKGEKIYIINQK